MVTQVNNGHLQPNGGRQTDRQLDHHDAARAQPAEQDVAVVRGLPGHHGGIQKRAGKRHARNAR